MNVFAHRFFFFLDIYAYETTLRFWGWGKARVRYEETGGETEVLGNTLPNSYRCWVSRHAELARQSSHFALDKIGMLYI